MGKMIKTNEEEKMEIPKEILAGLKEEDKEAYDNNKHILYCSG